MNNNDKNNPNVPDKPKKNTILKNLLILRFY